MAATVRPITLGRYSDSVDAKDDEVTLLDNKKIYLGTGNDLEIYHDGSNSRIDDTGTGNLKLQVGGSDKLEVTSTGISVTGDISATGSVSGTISTSGLDLADNEKILLGTGDDLEIYHDSSNSIIKDSGTGQLQIATNQLRITNANLTEGMIKANEDGAVELLYDNAKKLETSATGATVTGILVSDGLDLLDDEFLRIGAGQDLELSHASSGSVNVINSRTGALEIRHLAEVMAKFNDDGAVELYHNDVKKFETTSDGINIGGNLAANPFDYLRFGASQYGAADIRPVNETNHKVGLAFYVDGTADATINPTEKVRIQAGGGISFNGDTAAANALDDYETGEWTYTYGSNFSGSGSITKGWYVKIGDQVTCYLHIVCTAESGTDQVQVSIPFTSAADNANSSRRGTGPCMMHSANVPGSDDAYQISSYVPGNDTKCIWYISRDNHAWESLTNSHMTANTTAWHAQVTYTAA